MSGQGDSTETEGMMAGKTKSRSRSRSRNSARNNENEVKATSSAPVQSPNSSKEDINNSKTKTGCEGDKEIQPKLRWHFKELEVTDEDFSSNSPRLSVQKFLRFSVLHKAEGEATNENMDESQEKMAAKVKIRNVSNLPMTYAVRSACINTFKISPSIGWLPPKTSEWVEIEMMKTESELIKKDCIFVFGAPLFHKDYTKRSHLKLLWRAYGSHLFPYYHAEDHWIRIDNNKCVLDVIVESKCKDKCLEKNWKDLTDEECETLWGSMSIDYSNKFAWDCRLKELERIKNLVVSKANRRRKGKIMISTTGLLIFGMTVFVAIGFNAWLALGGLN